MMDLLRNNKGLSLVEVIVASVLSVAIGVIIFSVLGVFSNESGQSISSFMMNQQYDNVAQQIARDARRASFVFTDGETPVLHGVGYDTVTSIIMCDASGGAFAQYKIVNDILVEGAGNTAYQAGGGSVRVVPATSYFVIAPQRKNVGLHLSLCRNDRKTLRSISARKDVFICRN